MPNLLPFLFFQPGDDFDWDEEFALQDFLKNEIADRNCRVQNVQTDSKPEKTADKLTEKGEEEDVEEKWTVVDSAGEGDVRDRSTPLSTHSGEAQPGQGTPEDDQGEWGYQNGYKDHFKY